jgi:CRP-like cAMP-binding protein
MTEAQRSARLVREIFLAGFMSGLPPENISWATHRLARNMEDVHLRAGEVLYRKDDPTTAHYFVVYGELELAAEGVPSWILGERTLVGTIDLTLERPRSRTVTALRDTHLLRMPARDWLDMLEDNFELMLRGVEGLAVGLQEIRVALGIHDTGPRFAPVNGAVDRASWGRGPLGLVDRVTLLRGVPLFAQGEVQALLDLATHAEEIELAVGAPMVVRGGPNDAMFVLVSGSVAASLVPGDGAAAETFGGGMLVFGSRAATSKDLGFEARATEPTRALRIVREDYFDAMEEHFALARSSMKALAAERELLSNARAAAASKG